MGGASLFAPSCLLSLSWLFSVVVAQDFTPPQNWQNTQSPLTRSQRQTIAWSTAQKLQSHIDSSGSLPSGTSLTSTTTANIAIALSSQDLLNGNTTWKGPVTQLLSHSDTGLNWNVDLSYFGLAELSAYLAYNDTTHLDNAARNWDIAYTDFITAAAAQSHTYPRTTNTTTDCGSTLGGLIFDVHTDPEHNQGVSTYTISSWIAFSSRLASLTQNTTHLDAAKLSLQFAQTHLLNPGNVAAPINDSWSVSRCVSSNAPVTWDLGPFIEGLSIVANVTQDPSYTQMLFDLIPNATVAFTSNQGIVTEQKSDYRKGTLIRGLLEAKHRNPSNTAMATLIDEYITVQFNAVRASAMIGDDNYATSWIGDTDSSASTDYNYAGSIEALDVFNSAFALAPPGTPVPSRHSSVGAIVGGVVGGVAGAIVIGLVLFLWLRRRRRARETPVREDKIELDPTEARMVPEPFLSTPSAYTRSRLMSKGGSYSQVDTSSVEGSVQLNALQGDRIRGAESNTTGTDGTHPALFNLARRLDNLIDVLAVRNEVDDTPPEYDARHPGSHAGNHV
ncbi:unnamed protein product [Peniophora sp. CBMAI 1063]|nr:unnamed protein product [Peniophora sp. CBMAI 1063]